VSHRTVVAGPQSAIAAHGLRAALPPRWEARLFLRDAVVEEGASVHPVMHFGNFALPPGRGDFGSGAVEAMRAGQVFVALLEYDLADAGTPLFAARGIPQLTISDFAPNALQRRLPGQLGVQRFFTENGRAFCLYVVLGAAHDAQHLLDEVHALLGTVEVGVR
jgi:hypothetical protein